MIKYFKNRVEHCMILSHQQNNKQHDVHVPNINEIMTVDNWYDVIHIDEYDGATWHIKNIFNIA